MLSSWIVVYSFNPFCVLLLFMCLEVGGSSESDFLLKDCRGDHLFVSALLVLADWNLVVLLVKRSTSVNSCNYERCDGRVC